jgi:hypothetical protein
MIGRNVAFELERAKELRRLLLASHHRAASRIDKYAAIESRGQPAFNTEFFTCFG